MNLTYYRPAGEGETEDVPGCGIVEDDQGGVAGISFVSGAGGVYTINTDDGTQLPEFFGIYPSECSADVSAARQ